MTTPTRVALAPLRATAAEAGWAALAAAASAVVRYALFRQAAVRQDALVTAARPGCPGGRR